MKTKKLLVAMMLIAAVGCEYKAKPKAKAPPQPTFVVPTVVWPQGTVLVSRNRDESLNTSPGHWNHLAIYVGSGMVVESQEGQGGVIATPIEQYMARNYEWFPLFPKNSEVGRLAASKATATVGMPYRKLSSLFRDDKKPLKGLNCVSVVRLAYTEALSQKLPKLKKPDDILEMTDVFTRDNPLAWSGGVQAGMGQRALEGLSLQYLLLPGRGSVPLGNRSVRPDGLSRTYRWRDRYAAYAAGASCQHAVCLDQAA